MRHSPIIGQNSGLCLEGSRLEIKGNGEFLGVCGMEAFWRHCTRVTEKVTPQLAQQKQSFSVEVPPTGRFALSC